MGFAETAAPLCERATVSANSNAAQPLHPNRQLAVVVRSVFAENNQATTPVMERLDDNKLSVWVLVGRNRPI